MVFSDLLEAYAQHLCAVFDRLAQANLTVNLAKLEFAKVTVTYLGKVARVKFVQCRIRWRPL